MFSFVELKCYSVREKLDFLKKYDRNFCIFGSAEHKYLLNEPLTKEQISFFEEKYEVELPAEYRTFIKEVGDGGAGPGYGLFPLFENESAHEHINLKNEFLFLEDYDSDAYFEEQVTCECSDCSKCHNKEVCLEYEDEMGRVRYQGGSLAVCFEGCTFYRRLIMNGERCGEVWAESVGEGLKRVEEGFNEWYCGWLDNSIEMILPFVNAVLTHMPFDEIMKIKGSHLLALPQYKVLFVAGMMNMSCDLRRHWGTEWEKFSRDVKARYDNSKL